MLSDDFSPNSNVDVMVDFEPGAGTTLFNIVDMIEELQIIFGREVDLITRRAVEQSRNYLRRDRTLSSIEVIDVL